MVPKTFCREYKINQEALAAGKSGIVIGRYPGDHYAGGNPWQLLTAVLGETFYLGATATLKKIEEKGVQDYVLDPEENREWIKLLDTNKSMISIIAFISRQSAPTILVLKTLVGFVVVPFIFRIFVRYETFVTLK